MSSIPRRAANRDLREPQIIDALEEAGATVQQLSAKGVPDLLVGYLGQTHLIEVKTDNATLNEDQEKWHREWKGEPVQVVRNEAQAKKWVRIWLTAFAVESQRQAEAEHNAVHDEHP